MKQKLYFKIYLAVLASIVIFAVATALLWRALDDREERTGGRFDTIGQLIQNALPAADAPIAEQQRVLEQLTRDIPLSVILLNAQGQTLAQVGEQRGFGPKFQVALSGGRTAFIRPPPRGQHGNQPSMAWTFITGLLILFGAVALTALPLTRRLTRRLELLNAGVEQWGQGNLSARAPVQGNDEVAKLATSFNKAAGKVEELVSANKMLLANASHELRTPLTRIRMNVEMLKTDVGDVRDVRQAKRKTEIEQDISELDEMIEGILLSSRLEAYDQDARQMPLEMVDLLALVAEECAHYPEVAVSGQSVTLQANPKLLRRLVRNAVENAFKYGLPPVEVRVLSTDIQAGARAEIHFTDHGQGVQLDNPNDLFEPFVRAHRSQNGAGLGLSLVKKIAERHSGGAKIVSPKNTAMHLVVWL
ncbi:MAG: envZ [Burkholderiaceae bacterium]|nr:envZ [Burkholderiaceae bacterium]